MKKLLLMGLLAFFASTAVYAQLNVSTQTVVTFLNENGMTKFTTEADFRAQDGISRGESAKFIAEYASSINYNGSYDGSCTFSDIAKYDYTLVPHIGTVCSLWLIKGSNGMYMPNKGLTQAEALTILMRSQTGFEDETWARRYQNYFNKAVQAWLVTNSEVDTVASTAITRWRLGLWIYMILNPDPMETDASDEESTLENILGDLFGDEDTENETDTSASVKTEATTDTEILVQPRTIGATMNVYEEGQERRDGFQPFTKSQLANALANDINVVLYFSADRCPSCQLLTKSLEADQFAFPKDLLVLSIDFDEQTDLVSEYGVVRQHTLIFLNSDGQEDMRTVWTAYTLADIEAEL